MPDLPADITAAIDALATAPRASVRDAHAALVAAIRAHMPGTGCPGCAGLLAGLADTICDTCRAGTLSAIAPPLTVGAALAMPDVQRRHVAVEYCDGALWVQVTRDGMDIAVRTWPGSVRGRVLAADYARHCRLVPVAEADLDPTTRSKT